MKIITTFSIILFFLSCGGGYSSSDLPDNALPSSQGEDVTLKNIPQNISIFE